MLHVHVPAPLPVIYTVVRLVALLPPLSHGSTLQSLNGEPTHRCPILSSSTYWLMWRTTLWGLLHSLQFVNISKIHILSISGIIMHNHNHDYDRRENSDMF